VAETGKEPLTSSQAQSLAENELGDFEFVSSSIIWCEILSVINMVSKELQSKGVCLLILLLSLYRADFIFH
jgi:hypothetical protein